METVSIAGVTYIVESISFHGAADGNKQVLNLRRPGQFGKFLAFRYSDGTVVLAKKGQISR